MKLYLIRHAQTEGNIGINTGKETILTEVGIEQAKRLGLFFKRKNIDKIYCSKLIRAIDTLKQIQPYLPKISITFTKNIDEISSGIYNHHPDKYKRALKKFGKKKHEYRPPEGENLFDFEKRVQKFWDYIKKKHRKSNVLIISHEFFLRFLILKIFNLLIKERKYFELHNAGVSYFEFDKNFNVKKFEIDDYKHLIKYSSYERRKISK